MYVEFSSLQHLLLESKAIIALHGWSSPGLLNCSGHGEELAAPCC